MHTIKAHAKEVYDKSDKDQGWLSVGKKSGNPQSKSDLLLVSYIETNKDFKNVILSLVTMYLSYIFNQMLENVATNSIKTNKAENGGLCKPTPNIEIFTELLKCLYSAAAVCMYILININLVCN